MYVLLISLSVADLLVATLLIAMWDSMIGGPVAVAIWSAGLFACLTAPIGGFVLREYGNAGMGLLIAALPVTVSLVSKAVASLLI
jgi:hypothetical protein